MQDNPLVSVIIPVFNTEKYLRACLDSVVNQTLREIEIICVDDGSTDGSPAIMRCYAAKDARVQLLFQQNSGSGPARNRGIQSARGEYVAFMDADDLYPDSGTLERLYTAAKENGASICGGSFSVLLPDGTVSTRFRAKRLWGYTFGRDGMCDYADYQFDFGYHRFVYKRAFLLENGLAFPPYLRFQDPPFFTRAMVAAGRFCALREPSYCYRMGTGSRGVAASKNKLLGQMNGYADNLELASQHGLWRLYELTFARAYQDEWHYVLAAERLHDPALDAALARFDRAVELSRLPGVSRFCKWRYQKDRRVRESGNGGRCPSLWANDALVFTAQAAFRAWRSLNENGLGYFLHRLTNK